LKNSVKLPGVLAEIADLIGTEAAIKIATARGGTTIIIPANPDDGHWLVTLLGHDSTIALCKHYATYGNRACGARVHIPFGPTSTRETKTALVRSLIRDGKSSTEIALTAHVTERTVFRQKQMMKEENADD